MYEFKRIRPLRPRYVEVEMPFGKAVGLGLGGGLSECCGHKSESRRWGAVVTDASTMHQANA